MDSSKSPKYSGSQELNTFVATIAYTADRIDVINIALRTAGIEL